MLPAPPSWSPHFSPPPSVTTSSPLPASMAPSAQKREPPKSAERGSFQVVFRGSVSRAPQVSRKILFQNIVGLLVKPPRKMDLHLTSWPMAQGAH